MPSANPEDDESDYEEEQELESMYVGENGEALQMSAMNGTGAAEADLPEGGGAEGSLSVANLNAPLSEVLTQGGLSLSAADSSSPLAEHSAAAVVGAGESQHAGGRGGRGQAKSSGSRACLVM